MIELSIALCGPRLWEMSFGWSDHALPDPEIIDHANVLTIAFLFLKIRLWIFHLNSGDE